LSGIDRVLVEGSPQAHVSIPAQTTIGTTAALILPSNAKRKGVVIQNTGTTVLKLTFGLTMPTQSVYHIALRGGAVSDDGSGATYFEASWVGAVNAISSGAGGTLVLMELMTGSPDFDRAGDWGIG
jgi:hypothetical protein